MQSIELPSDIYSEIAKYFPLESQTRFRRVNRLASTATIDPKQCCIKPSIKEIADFIWEEHLLLLYDVSAKYSSFNSLDEIHGKGKAANIRINLWKKYGKKYFTVDEDYFESCVIEINPHTGSLHYTTSHSGSRNVPIQINTYSELYAVLQETKLIYRIMSSYDYDRYEGNWILLKGILSKRGRCAEFAEFCYYRFISKYLPKDIVFQLLQVSPITTKTIMKTLISRIVPTEIVDDLLAYLYGEKEENYTAWTYPTLEQRNSLEQDLVDYFNRVAKSFLYSR